MHFPGPQPTATGLLATTALASVALASVAVTACGSSAKSANLATTSTTSGRTSVAHLPSMQPKLLAMAPPAATNPDDITMLDGLLYVTYQNNAGKDGSPDGSKSTIVAFDRATGKVMSTYSVLGRCDGLTADPTNHRLLASVNEDSSSSLFVISPGTPAPVHYTYSPDPEQKGTDGSNGGSDAISVAPDGTIYVAHSNPDPTLPPPNNAAAVYTMTLSGTTASLNPLYNVNDPATGINDHPGSAPAPLGLTDPDSNRYLAGLDGGTLVQDAQADSKLVFSGPKPGGPLRQLSLTNAPATKSQKGVTPQLDDITQVTGPGTLYVVDQSTWNLFAVNVTAADRGKLFASQPNPSTGDKANVPALSVVDAKTGVVTQVDRSFGSPKGLLFVPSA